MNKESIKFDGYYQGKDLPHLKNGQPFLIEIKKDIVLPNYHMYKAITKKTLSIKEYLYHLINESIETNGYEEQKKLLK